jgi:tetratricopeptide (TPR) repeat protein
MWLKGEGHYKNNASHGHGNSAHFRSPVRLAKFRCFCGRRSLEHSTFRAAPGFAKQRPCMTRSAPLDLDDSTDNTLNWVRTHSRQVGYGVLGTAAIVAVLWIVRAQNERNEITASQQLVAAQRSLGAGNLAVAAADLKNVVDRFGSTRAGVDAQVLLAQVQLQQGKPEDALATLSEVGNAGPTASSVHALRGAALEQTGKFAEAAAAYMEASRAALLSAERESFKSDAARAYQLAGKPEDALKVWKEIAADPSSVLYNEALLRVGELTASAK